MTIRMEVQDLIGRMYEPTVTRIEMDEFFRILKDVYKMTPFEILALFGSPPTLEYRMDNKHLLLEDK